MRAPRGGKAVPGPPWKGAGTPVALSPSSGGNLDPLTAQGRDRETRMTEEEWAACSQVGELLGYLGGRASARKYRLFAVACCRHTTRPRAYPGRRLPLGLA